MEAFAINPSWNGFLWVIALALTVLTLDVFFSTEFLSVFALLGISTYGALLLGASWKWTVLVAVLCWVASIGLFYTLWKRAVAPLVAQLFGRGPRESIYLAEGQTGEFRDIEGKLFVYWNGELWPAECEAHTTFADRETVFIHKVDAGIFTIRPSNNVKK